MTRLDMSLGSVSGVRWKNRRKRLPEFDKFGNAIEYFEFDASEKNYFKKRGNARFVRGSDGSVWFTDSHYGQVFSESGFADFVKVEDV